MDPVLKVALSSWDWRPEVIIPLVALAALYLTGWWRLRSRTTSTRNTTPRSWRRLAAPWRPVSYLAGLVVIGIALISPIDVLVQQLFSVHMIQHLLLIMIAPPLLLLANPMPFLLWGLPSSVRKPTGRAIGKALNKDNASGQLVRKLTAPGVIWLLYVITVFGWHDPGLYNLALESALVHDLEHLMFFGVGMLFWWHVVGAGPVLHKQFGQFGKIAYVLAAIPPNMALGIFLAFSPDIIYTYYLDVPRIFDMSVLDDQRISGVIMWIPGSMMYFIAALVLIAGLLTGEQAKPIQSAPAWQSDELLAAPGLSPGGGQE
jgi:putative membrane protein